MPVASCQILHIVGNTAARISPAVHCCWVDCGNRYIDGLAEINNGAIGTNHRLKVGRHFAFVGDGMRFSYRPVDSLEYFVGRYVRQTTHTRTLQRAQKYTQHVEIHLLEHTIVKQELLRQTKTIDNVVNITQGRFKILQRELALLNHRHGCGKFEGSSASDQCSELMAGLG